MLFVRNGNFISNFKGKVMKLLLFVRHDSWRQHVIHGGSSPKEKLKYIYICYANKSNNQSL
jgi:hypothetical protein